MTEAAMELIQKDLSELKEKINRIESILREDYELSDWAKKELKKARAEKVSISHKEIMRKYAR